MRKASVGERTFLSRGRRKEKIVCRGGESESRRTLTLIVVVLVGKGREGLFLLVFTYFRVICLWFWHFLSSDQPWRNGYQTLKLNNLNDNNSTTCIDLSTRRWCRWSSNDHKHLTWNCNWRYIGRKTRNSCGIWLAIPHSPPPLLMSNLFIFISDVDRGYVEQLIERSKSLLKEF